MNLKYQYPVNKHAVILVCKFWTDKDKFSHKIYSCFSDTGRLIQKPSMYSSLHISLKKFFYYAIITIILITVLLDDILPLPKFLGQPRRLELGISLLLFSQQLLTHSTHVISKEDIERWQRWLYKTRNNLKMHFTVNVHHADLLEISRYQNFEKKASWQPKTARSVLHFHNRFYSSYNDIQKKSYETTVISNK